MCKTNEYTPDYLQRIGPYPWVRNDKPWLSGGEVMKTILLAPLLLPRAALMLVPLALGLIIALLIGCGHNAHRPITGMKLALVSFILKWTARWSLFWLGFWWISIDGLENRARGTSRPAFVVSNHLSYLDVLFLTYVFPVPAFVAKSEVKKELLIGNVATMLGSYMLSVIRPMIRRKAMLLLLKL